MELEELVVSYGKHDQEMKDLKKVCDFEKDEIKRQMTEKGSEKESYGGFKVTKTIQHKQSFNEAKALEILKTNGIINVIKTIEILDMDALENEMYQGNIAKDVILALDACRSETEVVALKCVKETK